MLSSVRISFPGFNLLTTLPFLLWVHRICGSYETLSGGLASEAMTDFTGGVCERFNFQEELPDNMFQVMLKARQRRSLMSCSIDVSLVKVH